MDIGKAAILGIVQGLTEFLPVSSSGHLVLGKHFLGLTQQGIEFEVFVHFGTLLAVVTIFWRDLIDIVKAFFSLFTPQFYKVGIRHQYQRNTNFKLLIFLIVATIPAAVIGLLFEDNIVSAFQNPKFTCAMLIVTALLLFLTLFVKRADQSLKAKNTVVMGFAQAMAILPGISRSGSTISAGLFLKVNGDTAARFSFLLAVPAILGATVLKIADLAQAGIDGNYFLVLAVGMISAYISGYLAIETLLGIVRRGKLYVFAPYCFILGLLGLIFI